MITVFSGGVWALIQQADLVSKIVLILLLALSIICWSLFLFLILRAREQRYYIARLKQKIMVSNDLSVLHTAERDSLIGRYAHTVSEILKTVGSVRALDERGWELLQQQLVQRAEQLMTYNESAISILSTSASVSPLLGLFGTVWGLVHAFMNIALTQSADITAVAPGIAEALITTIAGLIVAIPALVMYNITVQMQARTREDLYELVDTLVFFLHRTHS